MSTKSLFYNRKVSKSAVVIVTLVFSRIGENVTKKSTFYSRKVTKFGYISLCHLGQAKLLVGPIRPGAIY